MIIVATTHFPFIFLSGLPDRNENYELYFDSRSSIAQLLHTFDFESYLHDRYFDSFQTIKRHPYSD